MAIPLPVVVSVISPVLVPDKLATAPLANIAFVIAAFAIAVALPVLVTGPVRLALVVTVAALPVILPFIGLVTVSEDVVTVVNVPFVATIVFVFTFDGVIFIKVGVKTGLVVGLDTLPATP